MKERVIHDEGGYKEFKLGDWILTKDCDAPFLKCPDCHSGIIVQWYTRAVGTNGLNYCPYCGMKRRNNT